MPDGARTICDQEKILKNCPVPGRLSNSPVMCTSLKSYDVSFICDHSISLDMQFDSQHLLAVIEQKLMKILQINIES